MKRLFLFFTVLSVFLLSSCVIPSRQEKTESAKNTEASVGTTEKEMGMYKKISAKEAYDMMSAGGVTVVDVRTRAEYDEGHIKGAVLVPDETIVNNAPSELQDKQAVLLVYCRSGRRSHDAANKLLALGYENVYDFGGIIDWPYEKVKD